MKYLKKDNARLRRAISDLALDKLILQEAARGNHRQFSNRSVLNAFAFKYYSYTISVY